MTRSPLRVRALLLLVVAAIFAGGSAIAGNDASLSADAIVEKMLEQDPLGYGGAEARLTMVLVNDRNQENRRKVVMMSRKDGDLRRIFVRFQSPADVAGTSFLGIDDNGNRTQFLFLPAMAKSRRISGKQRNASFVGTDYSYADLDNRDIDDSTKKRLADEKVGSQDCFVVEVAPSSKESAYAKVTLWIAKSSWLPARIRFFDAAGGELGGDAAALQLPMGPSGADRRPVQVGGISRLGDGDQIASLLVERAGLGRAIVRLPQPRGHCKQDVGGR